jgi:hypothetical protein
LPSLTVRNGAVGDRKVHAKRATQGIAQKRTCGGWGRILGASMREAHAMASGSLEPVLSSLSAKEIEIDDLRSGACGS